MARAMRIEYPGAVYHDEKLTSEERLFDKVER